MLQRIITAAIAICIAIVLVIFSGTIAFNFTVAALTGIMLWEALHAKKCNESKLSFTICMLFGILLPFFRIEALAPYSTLFFVACGLMSMFSFLVHFEKLTIDKLSYMIAMTILISSSMNCLMEIRAINPHGAYYLCLTLAAPWIADAGAYFIGVTMGKHKLCPSISPKKTIEGAVGGVVTTIIVFVVACVAYKFYYSYRNGVELSVNYLFAVTFAVAASMLAIIGDLVASLIKRQSGIKDFGNLLPGHGGLLDRFDSVLFVAPIMMLALRAVKIFY